MRTPAESAGKKAKCPKCEAVVDVPDDRNAVDTGRTGAAEAPNPYLPPDAGFQPPDAPAMALGQRQPIAEDLRDIVFGPPTEVHWAKVTFDEMLQRSWGIFTQRIGVCLLYALIVFGVNIAFSSVTFVINISTQLGAQAANMAWIAFVGSGVSQILTMVFQSWITAGAVIYMLDMARYGNARFSDIFRGHPYMLRVFLFNLLILVVVYGIPGVLGIPGFILLANNADPEWIVAGFAPAVIIGIPIIVWLTLTWYITVLTIIERNQSILQAIKTSSRCMKGNRLIVFAGGAAVGALCVLFTLLTCGAGMFLVIPFAMLFSCAVYLLATGQAANDLGVQK